MRLHRLTIPYRGLSRGVALASLGFFLGTSLGSAVGFLPGPVVAFPLAVVGFLVGAGYEVARYRRFEYELGGETLDIASGVFSRRRREIPLGRVQNVDVSRSAIQRVLGIAAVSIETAGGGQTEASLEFVGEAEASRLQSELRERRADLRSRRTDAGTGDEAGVEDSIGPVPATESAAADVDTTGPGRPEPETLFELSDHDLLLLSVLSFDLRALSALVFFLPLAAPVVSGYLDGVAGATIVAVGIGVVLFVGLVLWAVGAISTFVRFYGFRLTRLGEDLHYERGLLQRHDGSIPLDKLQSVAIEENLLMRQFGFAALAVETAGYAPGQSPSGGSEAAVPLATRERVLDLAREIEAFEPPAIDRPPRRAQRRYAGRYALAALGVTGVVGLLDAFVVSLGQWYLVGVLVLLAPLAARARWQNLGYGLGDDHAFARAGFWNRRTAVVPYYRIQNVITRRTIFQRRWRLATVILDTAGSQGQRLGGGDARFVDADVEDAASRRETIRERLVAAVRERQ